MIKFRAWDKVKKQIYQVEKISYFESGKVASVYTFGPDYSCLDMIVLERSTGLNDESGNEIYEGDIVAVSSDDWPGYRDVICWGGDDNYPAFDLKYHAKDYDSNALSEIMAAGIETIEVIGNVHENPELLEEEK